LSLIESLNEISFANLIVYFINEKSFISGDIKFYKSFLFGEIIRKAVVAGGE
jgi:hypothetical protein